jgi:hypothetical protein
MMVCAGKEMLRDGVDVQVFLASRLSLSWRGGEHTATSKGSKTKIIPGEGRTPDFRITHIEPYSMLQGIEYKND